MREISLKNSQTKNWTGSSGNLISTRQTGMHDVFAIQTQKLWNLFHVICLLSYLEKFKTMSLIVTVLTTRLCHLPFLPSRNLSIFLFCSLGRRRARACRHNGMPGSHLRLAGWSCLLLYNLIDLLPIEVTGLIFQRFIKKTAKFNALF